MPNSSTIKSKRKILVRSLFLMMNDYTRRDINTNGGNYNENIEGNYIQGNFIQIDTIPKPKGFPQNIPRSSTDKFVGRKEQLKRLHKQLQEKNQVTIAHIEGMGGIGKTELAIVYSLTNLQCDTYPGGICWLFCRDQDIGLQIVNFARNYLGLNPPEDFELLEQVTWCWQRWNKGNTLIVLDDVTDYEKIESYLPPQSSQFKVLVTTRLKLELANPLYLKVLSESESIELLSELIGSEKVNLELATAKELCQRLGYLPLALQLVGRYVKKRGISLSEELRRLENKGLALLSTPVREKKTKGGKGIKRGVAAAFELSWEELTESAQELGCLLSLFALAPIPWSLVESSVEQDPEELEDIRIELEDLHLLQTEDSYQLHQLIQEFFRVKQNNLANAEQQKRNFCTAIAEIANQIPQVLTVKNVNYFSPFIPHLAETATFYRNRLSNQDLIKPFIGSGRFYQGQGAYQQALPWCEKCLSVTRERFGESHPDVATSINDLATIYRRQGKYSKAEPLYLQALELRKQLLGEEHPSVATSINDLALLYRNQGKYSKAESLHLQALELRKQLLRAEHPDVATSINNLAFIYKDQGKYSKAEPLYLQALELRKQLLGEEHPDVATSINNLATIYRRQGKYSKAESLYLQSLELRKKLLGEEHPSVATSINNLAFIYKDQGRYEEAEPLLKQALELRKKLLGKEHPSVATSINNLALLYKDQGKYSKAESLYLQSLELRKKLLGAEHPSVATSINNLARLYDNQGRYEEAATLYKQASKIAEAKLGENHPNTNRIRENLQYTLDKM
ncbi:MAG: tetratricopeptide repeat protein [Xenococcus sp. (in: cyanobacteria)]